jgi:hypothetical protein
MGWYKNMFSPSDNHKVVAEVGRNYLFSKRVARRVKSNLGSVQLMVNLREPTRRAYSAYLYLLKHDLYRGNFEQAINEVEELKEHGKYMKHLHPYIQMFGKERIYWYF